MRRGRIEREYVPSVPDDLGTIPFAYPPRYIVPSTLQTVKNASNARSTNLQVPDVGVGSDSLDRVPVPNLQGHCAHPGPKAVGVQPLKYFHCDSLTLVRQ